jgi:hypothetical protein
MLNWMGTRDLLLSREQRDEIMRAISAIECQVQQIKPGWQAAYVIGTNLTIIRTNLISLSGPSSN